MPPSRLSSNRVSWDHSVLTSRSSRLDWKKPERPVETKPAETVQPWWGLAAAWGLLAWSGVTAWMLWTRNDSDSHVSMRFLMRGDFEEIAGVFSGMLWAGLPAAGAFWLSRRAREITMDEIGGKTYWASLAVLVIAWMGLMRPTWDGDAGSRFVRVRPAEAGQQAASADAAYQSSMAADGADGFGVVGDGAGAFAGQASGFGEVRLAEARADGNGEVGGGFVDAASSSGSRHWARSRVAAIRRAHMDALARAGEEAAPVFGPTAEAAGFDEGP